MNGMKGDRGEDGKRGQYIPAPSAEENACQKVVYERCLMQSATHCSVLLVRLVRPALQVPKAHRAREAGKARVDRVETTRVRMDRKDPMDLVESRECRVKR